MVAKVVLDISAIVWDEDAFNTNAELHHKLASEVILFIQAFESCKNLKLVARAELLSSVISLFPYKMTAGRRELYDFKQRTRQFLSHRFKDFISYDIDSTTVSSSPNICYSYFSPDLKAEIGYLITEMHNNSERHIFCAFGTRWHDNNNLRTSNGKEKEHHTVIHKDANPTIQDYYLKNIRNIFEHNPKHDSCKGVHREGEELVCPLSCYNERTEDVTIPQSLLDSAIQYDEEYYNYDDVNKTFVCFKKHHDNKYHGYDEKLNNVPRKIKEEFHK